MFFRLHAHCSLSYIISGAVGWGVGAGGEDDLQLCHE